MSSMTVTKRAFHDTLPIFVAYFPLGLLFGCLFVQLGFPWYLAPIMSTFVYGGSVQFLCLNLLSTDGTLIELLTGSTLLSLRNFCYGFAMLDRVNHSLPARLYMMFGLVDPTYSLLIADQKKDDRYAFAINWMIHLYWVAGTFFGALLLLPPLPYIEFTLPALFTCLVVDHWKAKPALVAAISALTASYLLPDHFLLIATMLSLLLLLTLSATENRTEIRV